MTSLILCSLPSDATALLGNEHKINDVIMPSRFYHVTSSSFLFGNSSFGFVFFSWQYLNIHGPPLSHDLQTTGSPSSDWLLAIGQIDQSREGVGQPFLPQELQQAPRNSNPWVIGKSSSYSKSIKFYVEKIRRSRCSHNGGQIVH